MPPKFGSETHNDEEEWDDCDQSLSASQPYLKPVRKQVHQFLTIDGIKSGLVQSSTLPNNIDPSKIPSDIEHQQQPPGEWSSNTSNIKLFNADEEKALPRSLVMASNNRLSYDHVIQYQRTLQASGNNTLPFFFYGATMFPSIVLAITTMPISLLDVTRRMTPATVQGYERRALRSCAYPTAIRSHKAEANITGILVFGISDASRKLVDNFQASTTKLTRVRAVFETEDRGAITMDCGMYIQNNIEAPQIIPLEEKIWRVSDLMFSDWHLGNLKPFKLQEQELEYMNN